MNEYIFDLRNRINELEHEIHNLGKLANALQTVYGDDREIADDYIEEVCADLYGSIRMAQDILALRFQSKHDDDTIRALRGDVVGWIPEEKEEEKDYE